jgi:hypothetical protein
VHIPLGLRRDETGDIQNDYAAQSAAYLDIVPASSLRKLPPVYNMVVHNLNSTSSFTEENSIMSQSIMRSMNRSCVPISPYGIMPTTTFSYFGRYTPLILNGRLTFGEDRYVDLTDFVFWTEPPSLDFSFEDRAAQRLLDAQRVMNFNLGSFLATFGDTAKLLHQAYSRVASCLSLIRDGKFAAAVSNLKRWKKYLQPDKLGDAWLEFRYGWTPLMYDFKSLYDEFMKQTRQLESFTRLHTASRDVVTTSTTLNLPHVPFEPPKLQLTWERRQRWGYFCLNTDTFMRYNGSTLSPVTSIAETMELLINPYYAGWDLIPFSFAIDWFVNIGEYLNQIGSLYYGISVIDGYSRNSISLIASHVSLPNDGSPLTATMPYAQYKRERRLQLPIEPLNFDGEFKYFRHVIDSIFLVSGRLRGR